MTESLAYLLYFLLYAGGALTGMAFICALELIQSIRRSNRRAEDRKIVEDPGSLYRNDPPQPRGHCEGCGAKHPHLDAGFCDGCMTAASERF